MEENKIPNSPENNEVENETVENTAENIVEEIQEESQEEQKSPEELKDEKIAGLEKVVIELNDKSLRALAEADNVRRRAREEVEKASKYALTGFVGDLVTVVENFFLATDTVSSEELEKSPAFKGFFDGISMTKKELLKTLEKNKVIRIAPLNEKFDHNFHEAIAQVESDAEEGTVVQVLQAGYTISDRLIRPALVGVAKPKAS